MICGMLPVSIATPPINPQRLPAPQRLLDPVFISWVSFVTVNPWSTLTSV
jgi:hypothetical protein